jgi:hypothetical protein
MRYASGTKSAMFLKGTVTRSLCDSWKEYYISTQGKPEVNEKRYVQLIVMFCHKSAWTNRDK